MIQRTGKGKWEEKELGQIRAKQEKGAKLKLKI